MLNLTEINDLGFQNDNGTLTIAAKQFDTGRKFIFNIVHDNKPFDISDCSAYLRMLKADGKHFQDSDCCSIDGNKIIVDTSVGYGNQILTCEGLNICELRLKDSDGKYLTTWNFIIKVEARVHNGTRIDSIDCWDGLEQISEVVLGFQALFDAHLNDTDNPHVVTKEQVGLGNVDDTSDINKPISTAQQNALDTKVDSVKIGTTEYKTGTTVTLPVYTISEINSTFGADVSLSVDTSTYEITLLLKDKNGNTLSTQTVDLPIEFMFVNASYSNEVLTFTLKNGDTIPVNISDLLTKAKSYTDTQIATEVTDRNTAISVHNTSTSAHSDIRTLITGLTNRLNTLADSDDTTLDQLSEIVSYIKNNKTLIDAITTSKVNVSDIVNDLVTNVTNKPLSAAQGVVIKALIDAVQNKLNNDVYTKTEIDENFYNKEYVDSLKIESLSIEELDALLI